jgi:hypothetical protein
MVTIGLAIPCYKHHIRFIPRIIENLVAQTRKPDAVVISCSSVDADALKELESLPQTDMDLTIIPIKEYKNAAANRNIAANHLKTDLISFFDVDDLMHPQRTAFIENAYEKTKFDAFYHNHIFREETFETYTSCDIHILNPTQKPTRPATAGHVTVRRELFKQIMWPEGKVYEGCEDSAYLMMITFPEVVVTVYVSNALTKYESSSDFLKGLKMRHIVRREFGL